MTGFRKVSSKEPKFNEMKARFHKIYNDFELFVGNENLRDEKNKSNSGKASSYARYLMYMAIIFEEINDTTISDLKTLEGLGDIDSLRSLLEYKTYNKSEGGFPNATINAFQRYTMHKVYGGEEHMAYSAETGNKNIDILIEQLNLSRRGSEIVFQNDDLFVLSPSIQNQADWFDIREKNIERFFESKKTGLVIIRRLEHFLLTSLDDFLKNLMQKEYLKESVRGGVHWKFNIEDFSPNYFVYNQDNSNLKYKMIYADRDSLKKEVEKLLKKIKNNQPFEVRESLNEEVNHTSLLGEDIKNHILKYLMAKGFNYSKNNISNLYLSLRSKPFVIISGISGTGKTKIAQLFAESIGATEDNGQFSLVPVRPDWSDGSELLGYTDIKGDFIGGPLTKLMDHAILYPERPHFLLLDEMNLARVEYYFSDILSVMESRKIDGDEYTSSKLSLSEDREIYLPGNVYIIGTVNMDETTHPFSKKVLDRANTIEFNEIDLDNFSFLEENEVVEPINLSNDSLQAKYINLKSIYDEHKELIHDVSNDLKIINEILKPLHAQVGYRVRDEICFYMVHNVEAGELIKKEIAFDFCLMQKILPRIAGSGERIETVLNKLEQFVGNRYPRSKEKLTQMQERLKQDEFTSFWIA